MHYFHFLFNGQSNVIAIVYLFICNLYRYQSLHFQLDGYIARKVPGQGKMKKIILEFTLDVIELSRYLFQLQNWAVFWTLWLTKYW